MQFAWLVIVLILKSILHTGLVCGEYNCINRPGGGPLFLQLPDCKGFPARIPPKNFGLSWILLEARATTRVYLRLPPPPPVVDFAQANRKHKSN